MTNSLRRTLLMLNAKLAAEMGVTVRAPELLEDADGTPSGVRVRDVEATVAGVTVTTADLAAAGLTPADVPYIRAIDLEGDTA